MRGFITVAHFAHTMDSCFLVSYLKFWEYPKHPFPTHVVFVCHHASLKRSEIVKFLKFRNLTISGSNYILVTGKQFATPALRGLRTNIGFVARNLQV